MSRGARNGSGPGQPSGSRPGHGRSGEGDGHGGYDGRSAGGTGPSERPSSRRYVLAASAAAGLGLVSAACGGSDSSSQPVSGKDNGTGGHTRSPSRSASRSPSPGQSSGAGKATRQKELPRGGTELFPRYRLVGYCGLPKATALGRLGTGDLDQRAQEIEKKSRPYADGREPLPVLELLAVVASEGAGPDGKYRTRTSSDTVDRFHDAARKHKALLLLNIQPGRAKALDEVKALRDWLVHPDVGIALDPEWDMGPAEVPGKKYGHTSGGEIADVASYLSGLVRDHGLPQKPLVFHQVAPSVVSDEKALRPTPGVVLIKSADGIGSADLKRATWKKLVEDLPKGVHTGFKLFYEEDTEGSSSLMKPSEVLALDPKPEYVMYE